MLVMIYSFYNERKNDAGELDSILSWWGCLNVDSEQRLAAHAKKM